MTDNHIYVIFGASGDLTKRKLVPALYALFVEGLLPEKFALLGASRSSISDEDFRDRMKTAISEFKEIDDSSKIGEFVHKLHYTSVDFKDEAAFANFKQKLGALREEKEIGGNTVFYLSTPPSLYGVIPTHLASVGLNNEEDGWKRMIIEKPFGYDLDSALALKDKLLKSWNEEQLYRIDHYLGKETVQNLLVTRFSNGTFEPLWNRNYIHHVEITAAESIGIEKRGGYYDKSGALRDMVQNHLLQVAGITAMEPPSSLEPSAIRNEILKVFQSIRPMKKEDVKTHVIRGQYTTASANGEKLQGYRNEEGVGPNSITETYVALKFHIDNFRWGGVPFYIRTGKRLPTRVTEVVIHFKRTPHFLFSQGSMGNTCNQLVIRIQPDEGVMMKFGMKAPGSGFEVENVNMDFHYSELIDKRIPSAYERLIHDSMKGDTTLFARTEEVLEAWKFLSPVIESWKNDEDIPVYGYPAGSWGPLAADELIEDKAMTWRYPCKNLSNDGTHCEL
ncbi:glucose-6-phosphate dehydrogenase [Flagellimonas sp. CMM7]|uniref:glucose-6-phosphate dehydrogenase n=1 Tax=Flagellimonas sp. CMM7 TaxID=2654676 RepID=UPI0013D7F9A4|nr:glucose-6-phosphate dehydrogenase [Flagellimonas sp. CMM7]UII80304.1 glucose-6-phosphate dehydrogenase [Flagellimonas sp. CMM7]